MVTSMTGYGRAQQLVDGREISVEIKSVNHRYFEFSARTPRTMGFLDEKLKALVYEKVPRGKVDVAVTIVTMEGSPSEVEINTSLAESYLLSLRGLGKALRLESDITLSSLARFNDIFTVRKPPVDEEEIWSAVETVAASALEQFLAMKKLEGDKLVQDILQRLETIESLILQVEERSPQVSEQYRQRLYTKLCEILVDNSVDQQRILTEAAIFAEKTDVSEETVRLRSHIGQLRSILAQGGAVGRKLDFLVQEMNREANTIGSKAQDISIQHIVVELKSETEKIREQVQNIA